MTSAAERFDFRSNILNKLIFARKSDSLTISVSKSEFGLKQDQCMIPFSTYLGQMHLICLICAWLDLSNKS